MPTADLWSTRCVRLQTGALAVAVLAVGVRWALTAPALRGAPLGLVVLVPALVLLLLRRRPDAVALGLVASGLVAAQVLARSRAGLLPTDDPARLLVAVQVLALVVALLAGVAALSLSGWGRGSSTGRADGLARTAQVAGLLLLAPVGAEYLAAYDDSTGDPGRLLAGLVVFVPLYGCPALLIREVARRRGLGWPGMLALGAVFGLLQAGVVDQSLFSSGYRGIEGWEEGYRATLLGPLGLSAANLVNFVGGHVVFSICAPIALVEAARPTAAIRPWLSRPALVLVALGYLAASALVLDDHLGSESEHASPVQVVVTLAVALALLVVALRWRPVPRVAAGRPAPRVAAVLALALVPAAVHALATQTWTGVAMALGSSLLVVAGVVTAACRPGWGPRQAAAVAAAPLLVRGLLAFAYAPLVGEVGPAAKYGHNAVMLLVVLVAVLVALRPLRPRSDTGAPGLVRAGRTGT